jgi:octaprenyl-diphosphate synthase
MQEAFGLTRELAMVEDLLEEAVGSREPLLHEMARYVVKAGGKRLRPLSAILAYRAVGGGEDRLQEILDISTGLELIHTATLVHDDINDGARMRRGRPSCHVRYGTPNALIVGDFLFTKGFQISGRFDRKIVDWTADACSKLAEGEVLQARFLNNPEIKIEQYLQLVERKTACFIGTGIQIGAHLGGGDDATVESLGGYGTELGIAFQIVDDILDVAGDKAKTGKRTGIDIRDGNPTLPSILTLKKNGNGASQLLRILQAPRRDSTQVEAALEIIRDSGALEEARALAREFGERARARVDVVADPVYRGHLLRLVDMVLDRDV